MGECPDDYHLSAIGQENFCDALLFIEEQHNLQCYNLFLVLASAARCFIGNHPHDHL
ncbi:MAG: hypothetical protein LBG86_00200 [Puniceicoccales bacterium]|nr:hypothetical protein [Puniceicoccales bacterium]